MQVLLIDALKRVRAVSGHCTSGFSLSTWTFLSVCMRAAYALGESARRARLRAHRYV